MSEPSIIVRTEGRAGRIMLNRPKALHALNLDMCELMTTALLLLTATRLRNGSRLALRAFLRNWSIAFSLRSQMS